ncbi:hypothetical protein SKAU_G00231720 [Synaphobranchus kaupii]|uniref:Uncharacterized protein n=1 Tax=Synaphobranchus kaupii TaxID=118154 RepID=A0A9Q1F677_SYNKA|nr:hypothetical protein SKAU_G00231720 [Synaphobranchus kaupii]
MALKPPGLSPALPAASCALSTLRRWPLLHTGCIHGTLPLRITLTCSVYCARPLRSVRFEVSPLSQLYLCRPPPSGNQGSWQGQRVL